MVATVIVNELTGAGAAKTNKTSGTVRFKNADNATVDNNNPMIIPTGNSDYSFEKWLRCEITVAPDTEITNLNFYTDGTMFGGTDVEIYAKAVTAFATPAEATGTTGVPTSPTGMTNAESYTSGAPLSLGAGPYSSTGDIGDHCVLVMEVKSSATQGTLTAETLTFSYDEI